MTRRQRILIVLVVGAMMLGAVMYIVRPSPFVYEGHDIDFWLADIESVDKARSFVPPESVAKAEAAIRHFGTNAIPYYLDLIHQKDSAFDEMMDELHSH